MSSDLALKILDKYGVSRAHPESRIVQALYKILDPLSRTINTWIQEHGNFTYIKQPYQAIPGLIQIVGSSHGVVGLEQYFVLQTGITTENIGKKTLQNYIDKKSGHITDLYEYEPLVCMIPKK